MNAILLKTNNGKKKAVDSPHLSVTTRSFMENANKALFKGEQTATHGWDSAWILL